MKLLFSTIISISLLAGLRSADAGPLNRNQTIELEALGTFSTGVFAKGAAEIVAHDPKTQRLFIVNADSSSIDVLSISDPNDPKFLFTIDVTPYGRQANSVTVHGGLVAAAVEANVKTDPGTLVIFEADGTPIKSVKVGALPDMLTFTPDGNYLLVANEGEPNDDYSVDPVGSVSIIRVKNPAKLTQADVRTVDFASFNNANLAPSIRIFGPNATVAQDLEPEYITVSENSRTAYVTLQENNAIAVIDIERGRVERLEGLGFKDHSIAANGLDASDRDDGVKIAPWPVMGMYQPDAIASFRARGKSYLITANEGDARDYSAYGEESRVKDLDLDPTAFPNAAALQADEQIGRLNVTTANGDTDGDGDYDRLFSFGARSFSIRDDRGRLVWDSGSLLEQITAEEFPNDFNSDHEEADSADSRSDNKGPEPEGLTIGTVNGKIYAFIGLERFSFIAVFNIENPREPEFVQLIGNRDFEGDPEADTAGDLGPEGLTFISAKNSPNGQPLLVVANEISGSTTIYGINTVRNRRAK